MRYITISGDSQRTNGLMDGQCAIRHGLLQSKKMPNEIEAVEEWVKKEILEKIMAVPTSTADKEVSKTLKETTEHLSSTSMELRPLFSKPKTKTRTLDDVIDEMLYCKNCGAYVCYPTEHNAKDEYKYCHYCGKLLDWDNVSMSEDYRKLEEIIK